MFIFDYFITTWLGKRIAAFKRHPDGTYTHKTYSSLLDMPPAVRMEYMMQAFEPVSPDNAEKQVNEDQVVARRNLIKAFVAAKVGDKDKGYGA